MKARFWGRKEIPEVQEVKRKAAVEDGGHKEAAGWEPTQE